jgi:O-methyltransferase
LDCQINACADVLESGGRKPAEDTQNLNAGAVDSAHGYREQTLRDGRCRQFGGTSNLLNRQVRGDSVRHIRYVPLDEIDFERRDWVPESGWPFSFDDRCSVIEGDFFGSLPSGADTYLFRHIIHDWSDEQSVQILNNCRKVIPNNGRLLLIEAVVPTGNASSLAQGF